MAYRNVQPTANLGVFVLRVAFAALSGSAMLSVAATLSYMYNGAITEVYVAALSTIINAVAAWHYNEIVKVRTAQATDSNVEWAVDALRCGALVRARGGIRCPA